MKIIAILSATFMPASIAPPVSRNDQSHNNYGCGCRYMNVISIGKPQDRRALQRQPDVQINDTCGEYHTKNGRAHQPES
jgi:hypothetical protein